MLLTLTPVSSNPIGAAVDAVARRYRYHDPVIGRFTSFDSFEASPGDPTHLHKYNYAGGDPVNNVDPSGYDFSLTGMLVNTGLRVGLFTMNVGLRVAPAWRAGSLLANRVAFHLLTNSLKYELGLMFGSLFLDAASSAILDNLDPVPDDGTVGTWVENKMGANSTKYNLLDDLRDGTATSIKTNSQTQDRMLRELTKEATTMANHNSDFQPKREFRGSVSPIPLSSAPSRAVMMVIPETNGSWLRDPAFRQAIQTIATQTKVAIRVVPLRGWRK